MVKSACNSFSDFSKQLYNDPFRWQLVKTFTLFTVAVFFAREMAAASVEGQ